MTLAARALLLPSILFLAIGCEPNTNAQPVQHAVSQAPATQPSSDKSSKSSPTPDNPLAPPPAEGHDTAILAGGCFWCVESALQELDGVVEVFSGFTGGEEEHPSYREVSSGTTGHTEAVWVEFDPDKISYEELLHHFWRSMDPTDAEGQFADRGSQYRPAIFVQNDEQRQIAEASKAELEASGPFDEPIIVPILDAMPFYLAEPYHQDFYKKKPRHYRRYVRASGRKGFIERTWKAEKTSSTNE